MPAEAQSIKRSDFIEILSELFNACWSARSAKSAIKGGLVKTGAQATAG
jgi:hypothetical protein